MKSFINWLWTGFGTGMTSFRALGMTLIVFLLGIIVVYYIIKGIINLFTKKKAQPQP